MNVPLPPGTLQLDSAPPRDISALLRPPSLEDTAAAPVVRAWRAVMLRKWAILALAALVAAVAAMVVMQTQSYYSAAATVLVEAPRARLAGYDDAYGGTNPNREFLQTQAEVMRSREVVGRVVDRLQLAKVAGFDPRQDMRSPWKEWLVGRVASLGQFFPEADRNLPDEIARAVALGRVQEGLTTEVLRNSLLIRVRSTGPDAMLAAQIANAVVESYIETEQQKRLQITEGTNEWVDQRARELKGKLDAAEKALQVYREKESLVVTRAGNEGIAGPGRELSEFSQRLVEVRVKTAMAKEAVDELKRDAANGYLNVPEVLRSSGVQAAREVEATAQKNATAVGQRYGPDHPRYAAAIAELNQAKANVEREIKLVVDGVQKEYNSAKALEKTLEQAQNDAKSSVQVQSRKEVQLGVLEREASAARQIYENFLSRFKQAAVTSDAQTPGPRIVDAATPPGGPSGPDRRRPVVLAFLGAMLLGVLASIGLSNLTNTVQTTTDVEEKLGQPLLAATPTLRWGQARAISRAIIDDPQSVFSESIRTACTGIMLSAIDSARKTVTVTSSLPGEGKSTVSLNLALSLAKSRPTVLIEADLRRPSVARALGLPAEGPGMSEVIAGSQTIDDCLNTVDGSDLKVIVCGRIPPNPLEMLASQRFRQVLAELQQRFEIVVIDSPPLQLVSDALVLGGLSDGIVHVVKADDTKVPTVRASLKRVMAARIPVFGVVLNQQDFRKAERYYGDYTGYGKYGYGKPYGEKPSAAS